MVVNRDAFFLSHRLPLARGARDAGFEVVVVTGESGSGPAIRAEGFEFVPLPITRSAINPFADMRTVIALAKLYRRYRPVLVHHSTVKPVIYGSMVARLAGQPGVVNTISGLGYAFTSDDSTAIALRPIIRGLWRIALLHPRSRTIFQNPDDRADFIRMGLVREDATVLIRGSGIDCSRFHPSPEPMGVPLVVLPSRMLWDKGVREFVEAARSIRARGIAARFALVGAPDSGNRAAIPEAQLAAWTQEGVVEWWGQRADMPAVLASASVVALPSYGEGLPKVLLEAAAAGRPVVTTDVRGCREVVRPGVNGFLVPPRDSGTLAEAIERLLQSAEVRATFGRAGRHLAETEFAEAVVVKQTLDVYRQVLNVH
jgi:glycosyltransferase involved in cell wall biosynthesis